MLTRREVNVRKLLTKYHDDVDYLKKKLFAAAYNFDPHLAERVRAKNPREYSIEEKQWESVDRILHAEVWKYYVNEQNKIFDRETNAKVDINNTIALQQKKNQKRKIKRKKTQEQQKTQ